MANRDIITRTGNAAALTAAQHDQNHNSFAGTVETQTGATYTVLFTDQNKTIELNNASMVVTLPAIATLATQIDTDNFRVTLLNINATACTINRSGTDTIADGSSTSATINQWEAITLQTDTAGGRWNILNSRPVTSATLYTPTISSPVITGGTINGATARGLIMLATPQNLVNSTTTGSSVLMDMSVQYAQAATDGATIALISVIHTNTASGASAATNLYMDDATVSPVSTYLKSRSGDQNTGGIAVASGGCCVIQTLDSNSDFYWYHNITSGTGSFLCYLLGYFV